MPVTSLLRTAWSWSRTKGCSKRCQASSNGPEVLMGSFEEDYLSIPAEIIRLTIKTNQKCFVTRPVGGDALSNKFILVSNIEASDGGKEIIHGNGKVVRARLSDALHFWKRDGAIFQISKRSRLQQRNSVSTSRSRSTSAWRSSMRSV